MRWMRTLRDLLPWGRKRPLVQAGSRSEPWTPGPGGALVGRPTTSAVVPLAELARGNTAFATDLYRRLDAKPGTVFFSPFSVSTALAMALAGARGETAGEMAKTLRLTLAPACRHEAFARLLGAWSAPAEGGPALSVANRVFCQVGLALNPDFVAVAGRQYGAPPGELDFARQPEQARQAINAWIEEQTRRRIKELLARGTIDADSRLVLTSAIYFKGAWASPFPAEQTKREPFFTDPSKSHVVPMMHQRTTAGYAEVRGAKLLAMPYATPDPSAALSLVVVLPDERDGLAKLESGLDPDVLSRWIGKIEETELDLFLPRFRITSSFMLADALRAMGMKRAFTDEADFSGIAAGPPFKIAHVVHQAFVEVDEEGTEAAAATAVVVMLGGFAPRPRPLFRADHPFLFFIRDMRTGTLLFMGRVVDPAS